MEDKKQGLGNSSELRECFNGSCGRNWRLNVKGRFPSKLLLLWIMILVTYQTIKEMWQILKPTTNEKPSPAFPGNSIQAIRITNDLIVPV